MNTSRYEPPTWFRFAKDVTIAVWFIALVFFMILKLDESPFVVSFAWVFGITCLVFGCLMLVVVGRENPSCCRLPPVTVFHVNLLYAVLFYVIVASCVVYGVNAALARRLSEQLTSGVVALCGFAHVAVYEIVKLTKED